MFKLGENCGNNDHKVTLLGLVKIHCMFNQNPLWKLEGFSLDRLGKQMFHFKFS